MSSSSGDIPELQVLAGSEIHGTTVKLQTKQLHVEKEVSYCTCGGTKVPTLHRKCGGFGRLREKEGGERRRRRGGKVSRALC